MVRLELRGAEMVRWIGYVVIAILALVALTLFGLRIAAELRETEGIAAAVPSEGRRIETTLGAVYVEEAGPMDGVPLLLFHGTGAWSGLWRETLAALGEAGYRAIAFDMPPFGFSDRATDGDYSRTRQAERVAALVEALGIRPVIVAHSFGAGAALEAALRRPGSYRALIVIDGAIGLGSHNGAAELPLPLRPAWLRRTLVSATATNPLLTRRLLASLLYRKDRALPAYIEILQRPMVLTGSTAAFADWLPSLLVPPQDALSTRPEALAALTLPTVVIWGAEDTVTPLAQGEEIAALIPGAALTVIPEVGHIPQIEDPAAFLAALLGALQGLPLDVE
jgi:pimeloyl-ACP methyl ester carboxylesterase